MEFTTHRDGDVDGRWLKVVGVEAVAPQTDRTGNRPHVLGGQSQLWWPHPVGEVDPSAPPVVTLVNGNGTAARKSACPHVWRADVMRSGQNTKSRHFRRHRVKISKTEIIDTCVFSLF